MKKLLTILLICLMGMTILAGCGDDAATAPDNNGGAAGGETPEGQGEACLLYTSPSPRD